MGPRLGNRRDYAGSLNLLSMKKLGLKRSVA
jgi:hypothetical protein